jgi:hypothetical protein
MNPNTLPTVNLDGIEYFIDAPLLQIRAVDNPHNYHDLTEFELFFVMLERVRQQNARRDR